jgi:predicted nucleic acid-binding protein
VLTIIDTSVAVKWFLADNEPRREEALAVLDAVLSEPQNYAVPELFFNEMLAVLCRLLHDADVIKDLIHSLELLGMERLGNGSQLLQTAAGMAKQYGITGYDATFVAAAKLTEGVWLTADHAAVRKLAGARFVRLL